MANTINTMVNGIEYRTNGKAYFAKVIDGKVTVITKEEYNMALETVKQAEEQVKAGVETKAEAKASKRAEAIEAIENQVVAAFTRFTEKVATLEGEHTTKDKRETARPHTFMSFQYNGKALFEICWSSKGVRVVGKTKLFGDRAPKDSKVINNGSLDLYIPTFRDNITDTIYEYAVICSGIEKEETTEEAEA